MDNKKMLLFASAAAACCTTGLQAEKDPRPNILLICADDLGWSDVGCYGSEVNTPNIDGLAQKGVRFTSFHNTSKSFPSRACLLTGLYAQQVGYDKDFRSPIVNGITFGELLKSAGYVTLWSGKHHGLENPVTRGFDHYYGLKDGSCNYFNPGFQREGEGYPAQKKHDREWCVEDKLYAPFTPKEKDFYTTDYFANYALQWLDDYKESEKPIFLYLAFNAPHDPLMAWPEDIAKYKGKYKVGYEAIRKTRYEKQLKMELIDKRYQLSASKFDPWESLSPEQQAVEEQKMTVYAAMIDRMDQNIGRVLDKLKEQGKLDNTIVLFMSDNGASAEVVTLDYGYGEIGTLTNWTSLGENWANVCNTPFRYYKNYSYEGGIAAPLIISWPKGLKDANRISNFTGHFIDIMPTLQDLSGAKYPVEYEGRPVLPGEGVSLMPVVRNEKVERTKPVFWEWENGQAMKEGKWKIVRDGLDNKWSLFDLSADPSEVNDLAEKVPQQVVRMDLAFKEWQQRVNIVKKTKKAKK